MSETWEALCHDGAAVTVAGSRLHLHRDRGRWRATVDDIATLLTPPLSAPRTVAGEAVLWDARRARLLAAAIAEQGAAQTHPLLRTASQQAIRAAWRSGRGEADDHTLAAAHAGAVVALRRALTTHRALARSRLQLVDPDVEGGEPDGMAPIWERVGLGLPATLADPAQAALETALVALRRRRDIPLSAVLDEVMLVWLGGRGPDGRIVDDFRRAEG